MGACVHTRNFSFFPKSVSITLQGVPKKPQTIENDLLLEFQWPSTKLNVKSAKYWQGAYIKYWLKISL
jgi:hypothetical protein